jgi:hypothetical protein
VSTNRDEEPATVALHALIWTLQDDVRAERLLQLTGLQPDDLRIRADTKEVQVAVLTFLEAHEADLVSCARALGWPAMDLVHARMKLEGAIA